MPDAFLFYYSGHGGEDDALVGTEGSCLKLETIINMVTEVPELVGRPKMFILDCCRGRSKIDRGLKPARGHDSDESSADAEWLNERDCRGTAVPDTQQDFPAMPTVLSLMLHLLDAGPTAQNTLMQRAGAMVFSQRLSQMP